MGFSGQRPILEGGMCGDGQPLPYRARYIEGARPLQEDDVRRGFCTAAVCAAGGGDGAHDIVDDDAVVDELVGNVSMKGACFDARMGAEGFGEASGNRGVRDAGASTMEVDDPGEASGESGGSVEGVGEDVPLGLRCLLWCEW